MLQALFKKAFVITSLLLALGCGVQPRNRYFLVCTDSLRDPLIKEFPDSLVPSKWGFVLTDAQLYNQCVTLILR